MYIHVYAYMNFCKYEHRHVYVHTTWSQVWVILGSFGVHPGIIWGSSGNHLGIKPGSFWDNVGINVDASLDHSGVVVKSSRGHSGLILDSCWNQFWNPFWNQFNITLKSSWCHVEIIVEPCTVHRPSSSFCSCSCTCTCPCSCPCFRSSCCSLRAP